MAAVRGSRKNFSGRPRDWASIAWDKAPPRPHLLACRGPRRDLIMTFHDILEVSPATTSPGVTSPFLFRFHALVTSGSIASCSVKSICVSCAASVLYNWFPDPQWSIKPQADDVGCLIRLRILSPETTHVGSQDELTREWPLNAVAAAGRQDMLLLRLGTDQLLGGPSKTHFQWGPRPC